MAWPFAVEEIAVKTLPMAHVYQMLEPGPVALLVTARDGKPNVMTMSWHMMVEFEPPRIACIVSGADHSFAALRATGECVIAVPPASMAERVVEIGNCSGREVDKLTRFHLDNKPAQQVAAPLLTECIANIECRVIDDSLVDRFNLFVLEAVHAWVDPARQHAATLHHRGWGEFALDGEIIRIKSRMR